MSGTDDGLLGAKAVGSDWLSRKFQSLSLLLSETWALSCHGNAAHALVSLFNQFSKSLLMGKVGKRVSISALVPSSGACQSLFDEGLESCTHCRVLSSDVLQFPWICIQVEELC